MKLRLLAGAACAALTTLSVPAQAATVPEVPASAQAFAPTTDRLVESFYAARGGTPLWLAAGPDSPAARALLEALDRSALDGLADGPAIAQRSRELIDDARSGDTGMLAEAERLLSGAWVRYAQLLQQPAPGLVYADKWVAPKPVSRSELLKLAAAAPSLEQHVRSATAGNPFYSSLRDAAWRAVQDSGGTVDRRVLASLERARALPPRGRYIAVDAASARLWMMEDGRPVDSMKVIVGKPSSQTPMLASAIYYATLNPYWNVPADLVRRLVAPKVVGQGLGYLKKNRFEVLPGYDEGAPVIDPSTVDWKAVAAGSATVKVRQLPGPGNSMGKLKFGFPNTGDIFLHDTPQKQLFASAGRDLSNGCIRLEDAERLGRWLLGRDPATASDAPEQHVLLPKPVPIYVTYLTAHADGEQLTFVDDVYGRDARHSSQVAALQ